MIMSGIAMVVYDSRIVHRSFKILSDKFRRRPPPVQEEVELGMSSAPDEVFASESNKIPVNVGETGTTASGIDLNQTPSDQEPTQSAESPISREAINDLILPYSIRTGFLVFAFFIATFASVMATRGAIHNLPLLYQFFANILLAGRSHLYLS
jgi:hypothetical protein